jgi:membrane fusion protein (multidrug efflux system)
VAHISTRLLAGQIEQAQAAVAQNQVQVQQAQANFVQQQATTQTGIAQAQSAVAGAKATLMGVDATLDGDKAALQNAQQALERSLTLQNDGLVARKDVESAQLAVQTAKSQIEAQQRAVDAQQQIVESQKSALEAARAGRLQNDVKHKDVEIAQQEVRNALGALKSAQSQVALYTLRAPLSGVVSNVDASVGENVDTTTKLAVIDNLGTMQIQLAIPADSVRDVHPGQEVSFTVDGQPGKIYRTTVKLVSTQVDPGSNTIQATGEVDNPRGVLSNGLFARANIVLDRHHNVCLVPKSAVLRDDAGQTNIAVVGTGDTVHMTHVQTGISNGDLMEIVSGIEPGQRVATTGAYGLPDGTKVAVGRGEPNQ